MYDASQDLIIESDTSFVEVFRYIITRSTTSFVANVNLSIYNESYVKLIAYFGRRCQ